MIRAPCSRRRRRVMSRVVALMCILRVSSGGELGELAALSADAVGFRGGWGSVPEPRRLALREQAGWQWSFPGESAEYAALQEKRLKEIMRLDHYQERVDNFVQYTQSRSVKNFTRLGFEVVEVDAELTERLRDKVRRSLPTARGEGRTPLQGIYGPTIPKFVQHGEPGLLSALQPHMERWVKDSAPGGLMPVTAYGVRVYERGSSLAWHTDRVDTHVISGIYHIDHAYDSDDEPWPIEIEGHDGQRHAVDLRPGQMLLYESAKCPHGRPKEFKGDFYASIFAHFKPRSRDDWPYTHNDIWLAVPPGWDLGIRVRSPNDPGERWAGAFLTHDSMVVHGMPDRLPRGDARRRTDEYPEQHHHDDHDDDDDVKGAAGSKTTATKETTKTDEQQQRASSAAARPPQARRERPLPKAVEQRLAAKAAPAPSPAKRRELLDKIHDRSRGARGVPNYGDQNNNGDDDDPDDDDEVTTVAAAGFLLVGLYLFGGFALVSTLGLALRRAYLTKGRSLLRYTHAKRDADSPRAMMPEP